MRKTLICVVCPLGCNIEVEYNNKNKSLVSVLHNRCEKGRDYSEKELFNPERIVTTTVRVCGISEKLVSAKTAKPVPKELTFKVVREASKKRLKAPVKVGDIIIENICGTGIDLITTNSVDFKETGLV